MHAWEYWSMGYCTQAGLFTLFAVLKTWGMLPVITEGEAQGDYGCIMKLSKTAKRHAWVQ